MNTTTTVLVGSSALPAIDVQAKRLFGRVTCCGFCGDTRHRMNTCAALAAVEARRRG